jgi:hypothetical protein
MSATTFDNVVGNFPIGFFIWDTSTRILFRKKTADIYDNKGCFKGKKTFHCFDNAEPLTLFTKNNGDGNGNGNVAIIGHFEAAAPDFQHQRNVFINSVDQYKKCGGLHVLVSNQNMIKVAISFAVRKVIPADWLNDRDQFLYPNDKWKTDREFRNDCLTYTLFHSSNNIQSKHGINHWIPFTESEVNARSKFKSNFMTDFIAGRIERANGDLFSNGKKRQKIVFSSEAKAVFNAGRKLWTYYHSQKKANVNASLYDIREHFQGRNEKGKMNNTSKDETYNALIADLRSALKALAQKIEPKVYEYGFLRR